MESRMRRNELYRHHARECIWIFWRLFKPCYSACDFRLNCLHLRKIKTCNLPFSHCIHVENAFHSIWIGSHRKVLKRPAPNWWLSFQRCRCRHRHRHRRWRRLLSHLKPESGNQFIGKFGVIFYVSWFFLIDLFVNLFICMAASCVGDVSWHTLMMGTWNGIVRFSGIIKLTSRFC